MKTIYTPILQGIESVTGYSPAALQSHQKDFPRVCARKVFAFLCRERGMPFQAIGAVLCRHHSTIISYLDTSDPHSKGNPVLQWMYVRTKKALSENNEPFAWALIGEKIGETHR